MEGRRAENKEQIGPQKPCVTTSEGPIEDADGRQDEIANQPQRPQYGLYNQGATCYLNSVLQVLFMTAEIHNRLDKKSETDLLLREIFEGLKKKTCGTENITKSWEITNVNEQLDAAEFLELILRKISPRVSEVFRGELKYTTKCSKGHIIKEENKLSSTLSLKNSDSVERSFVKFFQKKSYTGFNRVHCNECKKEKKATHGCEMVNPPQILTLRLKRFQTCKCLLQIPPIRPDHGVDVPFELQLKNKTYKLYGTVNHSGSLRSGHYTATVLSTEDNTWYECDDTRVNKVKEQPFAKSKTYKSRTVYLLMYRAGESDMSCRTQKLDDVRQNDGEQKRNRSESDADNKEKRTRGQEEEEEIQAERPEASSHQTGEEGDEESVKDDVTEDETSHDVNLTTHDNCATQSEVKSSKDEKKENLSTDEDSACSGIVQTNTDEIKEDEALLKNTDICRKQPVGEEKNPDNEKQKGAVTRIRLVGKSLNDQGASCHLSSVPQVHSQTVESQMSCEIKELQRQDEVEQNLKQRERDADTKEETTRGQNEEGEIQSKRVKASSHQTGGEEGNEESVKDEITNNGTNHDMTTDENCATLSEVNSSQDEETEKNLSTNEDRMYSSIVQTNTDENKQESDADKEEETTNLQKEEEEIQSERAEASSHQTGGEEGDEESVKYERTNEDTSHDINLTNDENCETQSEERSSQDEMMQENLSTNEDSPWSSIVQTNTGENKHDSIANNEEKTTRGQSKNGEIRSERAEESSHQTGGEEGDAESVKNDRTTSETSHDINMTTDENCASVDEEEMKNKKNQRVTLPQRPQYGLYNQGATCYLNSVLQVLFMTPEIHDRLDPESQTDLHLSEIFEGLKTKSCGTENITKSLKITDVYEQRDAAEYLELILHKISPRASEVFQVQLAYTTKCSKGHIINEETNPFWALPLSLKETYRANYRVESSFETIFQVKSFTGHNKVHCNDCNYETEATRTCEMVKSPPILILLLKRFVLDFSTMLHFKSDCNVDVPFEFELKDKTYTLYGMVNHSGSLRSGHYTATMRSTEDNTWYECNDTRVNKVREQPFAESKTYTSRTVYLLMYRAEESKMSCETQKQDDVRQDSGEQKRENNADNKKKRTRGQKEEEELRAKRVKASSHQTGGDEGNEESVKDDVTKDETSHDITTDENCETLSEVNSSRDEKTQEKLSTNEDSTYSSVVQSNTDENKQESDADKEEETTNLQKEEEEIQGERAEALNHQTGGEEGNAESVPQVHFKAVESQMSCEIRELERRDDVEQNLNLRERDDDKEEKTTREQKEDNEVQSERAEASSHQTGGEEGDEEGVKNERTNNKTSHDVNMTTDENCETLSEEKSSQDEMKQDNMSTNEDSTCSSIVQINTDGNKLESDADNEEETTTGQNEKSQIEGERAEASSHQTGGEKGDEEGVKNDITKDETSHDINMTTDENSATQSEVKSSQDEEKQENLSTNEDSTCSSIKQTNTDGNKQESVADNGEKTIIVQKEEDKIQSEGAEASSGGEEGNEESVKDEKTNKDTSHDVNIITLENCATQSEVKSHQDEKKENLSTNEDSMYSSIVQTNRDESLSEQRLDEEENPDEENQKVTEPQTLHCGLNNQGASCDLDSVPQDPLKAEESEMSCEAQKPDDLRQDDEEQKGNLRESDAEGEDDADSEEKTTKVQKRDYEVQAERGEASEDTGAEELKGNKVPQKTDACVIDIDNDDENNILWSDLEVKE